MRLFLVCLLLGGCTTIDGAAHMKGTAAARMVLPQLPARCRGPIPHAGLVVGDKLIAVLDRERGQLDKANAKSAKCADFYDDLRHRLK